MKKYLLSLIIFIVLLLFISLNTGISISSIISQVWSNVFLSIKNNSTIPILIISITILLGFIAFVKNKHSIEIKPSWSYWHYFLMIPLVLLLMFGFIKIFIECNSPDDFMYGNGCYLTDVIWVYSLLILTPIITLLFILGLLNKKGREKWKFSFTITLIPWLLLFIVYAFDVINF